MANLHLHQKQVLVRPFRITLIMLANVSVYPLTIHINVIVVSCRTAGKTQSGLTSAQYPTTN